MNRTYFPVSVIGGVAYAANSPPIDGEITQMRWVNATDTGQVATMAISLLPDQSDTGIGFEIYNSGALNLATQFTKAPRQASHDLSGATDGTDTGTPAAPVPYALAGDRLRVKVTPADTGIVLDGKLYIWSS